MSSYYAHYKGTRTDVIPTREVIEQALAQHADKFVKVGNIKGMAVFLTLTDETYERLEEFDISKVETLIPMAQERGENLHFVVVAADGLRTIRKGLRKVIRRLNPKTVSWWSPDFKRLHRFNLRSSLCLF